MPDNIVIEINMGELMGEVENLGEYIADRAAVRLLNQHATDVEKFKQLAREITTQEIRAAVAPLIASAIEVALQPTDTWGSAKGPALTLREAIIEAAVRELRKPDQQRGSSSRRTLVEDIIALEVQNVLRKELQEEIKAAREQVLEAVRTAGSEVITETIARLTRV